MVSRGVVHESRRRLFTRLCSRGPKIDRVLWRDAVLCALFCLGRLTSCWIAISFFLVFRSKVGVRIKQSRVIRSQDMDYTRWVADFVRSGGLRYLCEAILSRGLFGDSNPRGMVDTQQACLVSASPYMHEKK